MESMPVYEKGAHSRIKPVLIEEELKNSFLDYAMSVVVSRAIPDVRDGLKPVHRRVLYAMHEMNLHYNKSYRKSVRVVGDVLGKFHPHGESAVYNTMVGMVQTFSKRYPLLDGQGNWGSMDGDNAAAMRYTEVKMEKVSQEILADIDKNTVPFVPNFDESTVEPIILPSKFPNLLVNGTSGIAVGMATAVPPHNLAEVIDACLAYLADELIPDEELFTMIPGPDFPTGGIICGRAGIVRAYSTGRGNLVLRGVVEVEETKKGANLIISELPYQVNKAELIIKIADLVKNKIIEGISHIRDESDRTGIRVVIELKKGEVPQVVLNQLYKFTSLQTTVAIYMLALLDNRPLLFTLRQLIREFLIHRETIISRRTAFDLAKAQAREHILVGLAVALNHIDDVIELLKKSASAEEAIAKLDQHYKLSPEQSKAILDMRLQRLTGLEQEKIRQELEDIKVQIIKLDAVLHDRVLLKSEIVKELQEIKATYADKRRTRIEGPVDLLDEADLVPDEEVVVTLTSKGYIKRVPLTLYGVQHRGGKGKMGMTALDEFQDIVRDLFIARNHDELLFFTNLGRVYSMSVFQVPEASRIAKGRAVVNLLTLAPGEWVVKLMCGRDLEGQYLVMLTKKGIIKRTEATAFAKIRSTGIRALTLYEPDDQLVFCSLSSGNNFVVIATAHGQGIRFHESEVRAMGRQAAGVIGIRLYDGDHVIGMEVVTDQDDILFATEYGFGKRVRVHDFRVAHRGGYGVRTIPTERRNGKVIGLGVVDDESHVLLIDMNGKIIRLSPTEIRTLSRHAKGVRLIRLEDARSLAALAVIRSSADVEDDSSDDEVPGKKIGKGLKAAAFGDELEGSDDGQEEAQSDDSSPEHDGLNLQ